jgi:hypothetical protein
MPSFSPWGGLGEPEEACVMVTMVTMVGDLHPGCLADRLLTGLGQPQIGLCLVWLGKRQR